MGGARKALVLLIGIGVIVGGAFYTGFLPPSDLEEPTVRVEDIGDWGDVSSSQIEVIHTLTVQNPNNFSVNVSDLVTLGVDLNLNEVALGSVEKTGLDIEQGSNTVRVTSEINQNRIGEFWANFINQGETIHAKVSGELQINKGPGIAVSTPPVEVSELTNATPISDAMNNAGDEMEGEYTKEVNTENIDTQYLSAAGFAPAASETVTAGYRVDEVSFRWGEVTADQTEVLVDLTVTNAGDVAVPGVPDGSQINIEMNDIPVFTAEKSESVSVRNIDADTVLLPGETVSYTLVATADNQNVEQWLTTYVDRDERSDVRGELLLTFELGDARISAPQGGAVAYECMFQTGIFVDNQSQSTTCGNDGTAYIGNEGVAQQEVEYPTTNSPPTAAVAANTTSGDAPLTVAFDGSEASDPDDDIEEYIWRFKDGSAPASGQSVTHTFSIAGEYDVELVVVDSAGNRNSETVTITVDPRVGSSQTTDGADDSETTDDTIDSDAGDEVDDSIGDGSNIG